LPGLDDAWWAGCRPVIIGYALEARTGRCETTTSRTPPLGATFPRHTRVRARN